jgi:Tfp pilus assembly protein PilF
MKNEDLKYISLIFVLGLLVYFNSFWVGFIWDDSSLILENSLIKDPANIFKIFFSNLSPHRDIFYRPIQSLTYMIDFALYKFDFRGYHLTNILLHILCSALFYKLLKLLTQDSRLSFCTALLFLTCPLWVETVTYISGRADILMAVFIAASFIFFIKGRIWPALFLYLLSLLSKEASVAYPLALLLYIVLFRGRDKKTIAAWLAFLALTLFYAILRFSAQATPVITPTQYPFYVRALYFIKAGVQYIGLMFFPVNLHMSYTVSLPDSFFEPKALLSFLVLASLVFVFFYFLKREKQVSFFIGWFFIMLLPHSGLFPINAFFADHFVYIPSIGIFATFIYFLRKIKSKPIFNAVFAGYVVFFSLATVRYNFIWQDPVRFYQRVIKLSPNSFAAYNNLGVIYLNMGNHKDSLRLINRALEINPDFNEARLNLGRLYYLKKDYGRAIGLAKGVLERDPENFMALDFLGTFYFKNGQFQAAESCYRKAVSLNPFYVPTRLDLYSFYKSLGREEEAGKVRQEIEGIDRHSLAELDFSDAKEFLQKGQLAQARISVDAALRANPANAGYYNLKAVILRKSGDYGPALENLRKSLRLTPSNFEAYNNLGILFALTGKFYDAEINFRKAVSLNPYFADAYFNFGLLYFTQGNLAEARNLFAKTVSLDEGHALAREYLSKIK